MNTFYWLVKREFWEHRGGFLWAPVITVTAVVAVNIMLIIMAAVAGSNHNNFSLLWNQLAAASPEHLKQAGQIMDAVAFLPTLIVSIVLFFVLFSYCMKTLSTDRADRSILFWKSLPLSDLSTVLSKVFSAVIVVPVIAAVACAVGALLIYLLLAITGAMHGLGFGQILWTVPHPGRTIVSIFGMLPIYMIWMLPAVGWLMMCSAWSKGRVSRWAVALPIVLATVVTWVNVMVSGAHASNWFWKQVVLRIIASLCPGSWLWREGHYGVPIFRASYNSHNGVLAQSSFDNVFSGILAPQYHLLLTPEFLWGALAGAVMIGIAIWLRRWRTEL